MAVLRGPVRALRKGRGWAGNMGPRRALWQLAGRSDSIKIFQTSAPSAHLYWPESSPLELGQSSLECSSGLGGHLVGSGNKETSGPSLYQFAHRPSYKSDSEARVGSNLKLAPSSSLPLVLKLQSSVAPLFRPDAQQSDRKKSPPACLRHSEL